MTNPILAKWRQTDREEFQPSPSLYSITTPRSWLDELIAPSSLDEGDEVDMYRYGQ